MFNLQSKKQCMGARAIGPSLRSKSKVFMRGVLALGGKIEQSDRF